MSILPPGNRLPPLRGPALPIATVLLILVTLAGCASPPPVPCQGEDVLIWYRDIGNSKAPVNMLLVNGDHSDWETVFEENCKTAKIQKIPRETFDLLLSSLNEKKFFELVEREGPGDLVQKQIITVETPFRKWSLSPNPTFTVEERKLFTAMFLEICSCFNRGTTLQVIDNPDGADYFYKQKARIEKGDVKRQRP